MKIITFLKDVKIEFGNEPSMQIIKADIAPRSKGKLILPGASGYLRITDLRGFVCVEEILNESLPAVEITFQHPVIERISVPEDGNGRCDGIYI